MFPLVIHCMVLEELLEGGFELVLKRVFGCLSMVADRQQLVPQADGVNLIRILRIFLKMDLDTSNWRRFQTCMNLVCFINHPEDIPENLGLFPLEVGGIWKRCLESIACGS